MKTRNRVVLSLLVITSIISLAGCSGSEKTSGKNLDLNNTPLETIIDKAKEEGTVESVGMPDTWANWGETWSEITSIYGITHNDVDMSSAEELALFETEKDNATKDIGDVGQAFGPTAVDDGLTLAYKTSYWDSIPEWAKDKDGNWMIGYYGTMSIITNKDLVSTPPTSFADILNGDYIVAVGDVTKASQAQCAVLSAAIALGGSETDIQPGLDFFKKLAEQGRLDMGELSLTRLEKGEVAVALLWDYNALGYRDQFSANNANANFEVCIPSDGAIQSGYCSIINAYTKHPYAAALTREYIFSDEGQINLAKGYAKPIRSDVVLPDDVKAKLLPEDQYSKARMVSDYDGWSKTVETIGTLWQEDVIAYAK
jgi:putative spermidine/putrescine transport system substrate-binding protein